MDISVSSMLAVVGAYLLGSLSFAVIVSRLMGLNDPRSYGSGNPGATNVLRSGSKAAAVLTLLLDAVKGWLPVFLAVRFGPSLGWGDGTLAGVALAAFVGHVWPVFFGFQGGKGVATAAGVLMGLQPWLGLATVATWLLVAATSRYSSLAAIVAALLAPTYYLMGEGFWSVSVEVTVAICAMTALLLWRHNQNIQRLLAGTESRIGSKSKS